MLNQHRPNQDEDNGIGRIDHVPLRQVWPHEALDFTTWLQDNIEVLAEAIGFHLSSAEREQSTGAFSVDLIAEDEAGRAVVIENQLEKSNHDHLGKLLTYLVGIQARTAIWIVADPRPEHMGVITWLNESSNADFYLLKLEAIRIGDSIPAPLLTKIVGPSEEAREAGRTKKELADRERVRYRFFEGLLQRAKSQSQLHANISPSTHNYVGASAGFGGMSFNYVIRQHDAFIELYIDTRDGEENQRIFSYLFQAKEQIEGAFGSSLVWDTKEGRRACRIQKTFATGGYRDEDEWDAIFEELVEAMTSLESVLRPQLANIQIRPRNISP